MFYNNNYAVTLICYNNASYSYVLCTGTGDMALLYFMISIVIEDAEVEFGEDGGDVMVIVDVGRE